ncbi:hypothetical protein Tco_0628868 [Tanacetum coccineum]|uniref:Uncharacterized protein n=1 Tax=Tanacetum coccineum TaxID=301880 RepID=A0ABQ4WRK2_9ASTR
MPTIIRSSKSRSQVLLACYKVKAKPDPTVLPKGKTQAKPDPIVLPKGKTQGENFVMSDSEDSMVTYMEAAMQEPPSPEFAPEPVYPEFMPPEDEAFPAEEQPLPAAVSPTADSPGYIADSDLEEDPEEDPTDYLPTKETMTMMMMSHPMMTRIMMMMILLAISTLSPSPLTSYSSALPHIPSPPLPVSLPLPKSPPPLPASPTHPLGYRAVMIRLRAESPSTSHLLPLPSPIVLPHTRASMAMMIAAAPSTYILAPRSETPPSRTPSLLPIPLPTSSPP